MSTFEGTFDLHRIDVCQRLILIAAGTGLTPMMRVIPYAIKQANNDKKIEILLLFFNKTEKDILCQEDLEILSKEHK